jgi:hypothetical protein
MASMEIGLKQLLCYVRLPGAYFLGDYVALATGDKMLWYRNEKGEAHDFKGAHAGLTDSEMIVPLILIGR